MTTRDKEAVISENDELRRELGLYKSVGGSTEVKSRTRISRAPLTTHNLNASSNVRGNTSGKLAKQRDTRQGVVYRGGDMTLDELDD